MTITGGTALPEEDIDQMIKDAEAHAEEDRRRREAADARNQGDQLLYQTEKTLREHGDKISAESKAQVESAMDELREALKGDDVGEIRSKTEALATASQELASAIYAAGEGQAGAEPGPQAGPQAGEAGPDATEDVVDAEVVDEGDDQEAAG